MKQKILLLLLGFILLIVAIIFWQEYSYKKSINLETFKKCMTKIPADQDWVTLQELNVPRCKEIAK